MAMPLTGDAAEKYNSFDYTLSLRKDTGKS